MYEFGAVPWLITLVLVVLRMLGKTAGLLVRELVYFRALKLCLAQRGDRRIELRIGDGARSLSISDEGTNG